MSCQGYSDAPDCYLLVQAYEGPTIDVETVIGVLMAEDLSPAALAALKADALGLSFKPPPLKKQPKGGKYTLCPAPAERSPGMQAKHLSVDVLSRICAA